MARPLRLEHAGAIWHVTARGNRREEIVLDDEDRQGWLDQLATTVEMYRWRLYAWVLMTNHYHLLLETPEPNLTRGMHRLNGPYAQRFNKRHGRVGHLFQGRYKAILVERESHLVELTRYVILNPVRAGMVGSAEEYPWSSFRQMLGRQPDAGWLDVERALRPFGEDTHTARQRFEAFVADAAAAGGYRPWAQLKGQVYLGGRAFQERLEERLAVRPTVPEIPRSQQALSARPPLGHVLTAVAVAFETDESELRLRRRGPARKAFALLSRRMASAPLREVADILGINPWSASHSASEGEVLEREDQDFRQRLKSANEKLGKLARRQT
jgi:REP element-mobilizing transposase RayT